jgi:hypothetical protein
MAVGLPLKTTYADGDVYSASDVNDTNGTINTTAAPFAAAKNKIINGDYFVNQRNFTSNTTSGLFNFDRWYQLNSGGSFTVTPQTFTPGAAPVSGYEGRTFLQGITASQSAAGDYAILTQKIESVRTLAGQTATISFWAKASSGTPKVALEVGQSFGTGGSPSSQVLTNAGAVTISTSWARYSVTVAIPSISGKTLGTNNDSFIDLLLWVSAGSTYASRASSIGIQNNTFQFWGVQVEAGSTATAFQTASGTIGGELALCQRYYLLIARGLNSVIGLAFYYTSTNISGYITFPVDMRTAPAVDANTGTDVFAFLRNGASDLFNSFTIDQANPRGATIYNNTQASGTAGQAGYLYNYTTNSYVAFSAEL